MSKQTRFARAFEPWIAEWAEVGLSGTQERVMLLLAANMERNAKGQFEAWRPRAEMAEILGVSEVTVRNTVKALARKGLLKPVGKSYKGTVQRYVLMPTGKGYRRSTPIITKGGAVEVSKGVLERSQRGTATAPPTRPLEGASDAPSRVRPSATEIDYYAISKAANKGIV